MVFAFGHYLRTNLEKPFPGYQQEELKNGRTFLSLHSKFATDLVILLSVPTRVRIERLIVDESMLKVKNLVSIQLAVYKKKSNKNH